MRIKLETSEWIDDWYLIVRAEHDGRFWWEEASKRFEQATAQIAMFGA